MTDPLSIVAAVASLCSIIATSICHLRSIRDAPEERLDFLMELAGLHTLLCTLQSRIESSQSGDEWLVGIKALVTKDGPLDKLAIVLGQLESKLAPSSKLNAIARRLTWKFERDDIIETLSKIERMKTLTSLAIANDHYSLSRAIKEDSSCIKFAVEDIQIGVIDIKSNYRDEQLQKITDWLSPLSFRTVQNDVYQRHEEGTGLWLLESKEFQNWISGIARILWCPGMPGAGKTVLTSIVVNYLRKLQRNENIAVACVYFNYREPSRHTASTFTSSLLKQIIQDSSGTSEVVRALYQRHVGRDTRPSLEDYMAVLKSECKRFSKVFIIVDALDECREDDDTRQTLIKTLRALSEHVHIMVTSRNLPSISREFGSSTRLDIRADDHDVRRYIDGRISRASRRHLSALREQIMTKIVENAEGMFLLVKLHMDSIVEKHNITAVRRALENLPKGMDDSYDEVMERIGRQNEDDRALAMDVLSWITYACRPLSVQELQHALAVTPNMKIMDVECITDQDFLISVCAGLVVIDEASKIIRLVHHTTQEYFDRRREVLFPNAQAHITAICLTYLSLDFSEEDLTCLSPSSVFLEYAAFHWGYHARDNAEEQCKEIALNFFRDESSFECAKTVLLMRLHREHYFIWASLPFPSTTNFSPIHMCAFFGLPRLLGYQLENGAVAGLGDRHGCTPLYWAVRQGNQAVAKLLVARDDVHVNPRDDFGRTPLSWAAAMAHETLATTLLECEDVDVNSADHDGQTSLHLAAKYGYEGTTKLLLTCRNVEVNTQDSYGSTPLICAARYGNLQVVKLLLARPDVDVNSANNSGQTALHYAARFQHREVVEALLARKELKMNLRDKSVRTPLLYASKFGAGEMVGLLISRDDVDVNLADGNGRTPLHWAAFLGPAEMVKFLLTREEVEVNSADTIGRTPLFYASELGRQDVAMMLMSRTGINVNLADKHGETPLHRAISFGAGSYVEVMKLILAREEANLNLPDKNGLTPLHRAARFGRVEAARLLLDTGVDANSRDAEGWTALTCSTAYGQKEMVRLLISQKKVDVNSADKWGQTPLDWAKRRGDSEVVRILTDAVQKSPRM